ncbi:MAG: 50S ribosomal protein L24 [Proteobacteria bacterium]|jgi:large subunit ribosomal protein L24|nr:50S ribosomal protein L24 [Desulfocapsa sp.]MBU3943570.1 50S ribosomal protein L24 [Pseudomonadota bacterium]MCG2743458.1 50S ribosomal protein L24 [Desulfobacteraceae bacterium]MDO8947274.1 50S ribosomal protein L24 [Desulfocapsaceae bacterium]MBU4028933.1 50S ribosomal protein L24 [Pseudomonadota bacterium]
MAHGKTYLKKNDQVEVIAGKDKGRVGKILRIVLDKDKAVVERINMIKRHQKPTEMNQQGQIVEKEAPIHVSNLQLICPECTKTGRVGKRILEDGTKIRFCKSCGESIETKS